MKFPGSGKPILIPTPCNLYPLAVFAKPADNSVVPRCESRRVVFRPMIDIEIGVPVDPTTDKRLRILKVFSNILNEGCASSVLQIEL
jgi:hypothetical protein